MTTAIKRRRGTTTQHSTFTGLEGELTIDTTKDTAVVHDGATAGGFPLLREDLANNTNVTTNSNSQTLTNKTISLGSNTVSGTLAQFNTAVTDADLVSIDGSETLTNKTLTSPTINGNVATTGLNFDSNTFVIDATNNRVGIGTASPSATFQVGSSLTYDGSELRINRSSSAFARFTETSASIDSFFGSYLGVNWVGTTSNHPIAFYTNSAERMRIDSSGNVGIGTSSPSTRLTVGGQTVRISYGTSNTNELFPTYSFYNTTNSVELASLVSGTGSSSNNGVLTFNVASSGTNTERMRLDSSGNLGLGVTPSAWVGSARAIQLGQYTSLALDSNGSTAVSSNAYESAAGTWRYSATLGASRYSSEFGAHKWFTAPSGTAGNAITFTQAMTLDASGNLGIGTTSPTLYFSSSNRGLSIGGTSNGAEIDLKRSGSSSTCYIVQDVGDNFTIGTSGANVIRLYTNDTERMRIDSSGRVGIGTSAPAGLLGVTDTVFIGNQASTGTQGTIRMIAIGGATYIQSGQNTSLGSAAPLVFTNMNAQSEWMRIDSSGNLLVGTTSKTGFQSGVVSQVDAGGSGVYARVLIGHSSSTGSGEAYGQFLYNGGVIGSITQSGTTAVAYNTSSDYRLKNTIAPMTGALAKVSQLKPVTYKWNADGSDGEGFIAHELAEVCPQAVTGEKDAVDAEGNPVYQGIDTSFLVATLTAALQELNAKVDSLQAELNTLKGN